jgi:hypothetical protein
MATRDVKGNWPVAILIVASSSNERGQRTADLVEQGTDLCAVTNLFAGRRRSRNLTGLRVHTEMQLPPDPARLGALLFNQPLARTA